MQPTRWIRRTAATLASLVGARVTRVACSIASSIAVALVMACSAGPVMRVEAAQTSVPTQRLHALFEARWEAQMRAAPEWATFLGDHRWGDRFRDASPAAVSAEFAAQRNALEAAQAIAPEGLSDTDRISREVFIASLEDSLATEPFEGFRSMTLGSLWGFHSDFARLLQASPVARPAEVEQMLARMAAYPARVDQEIANLREGRRLGWVPSKDVLDRVLVTIDRQIDAPLENGPFYAPFDKLGSGIAASEQAALRERAKTAIQTQVLPAMRRLRGFVADAYRPAAAAQGALSGYPGGAEVYAQRVRSHTTTTLTPAELHATGRRELARLRAEMEAVQREVAFSGTFAQFVAHLNEDPKFFSPSAEAQLDRYRAIAKRIDPELPRLFARLPRAPYGIRALPAHASPDAAASYDGPALDGSTPGWFNANTAAYRTEP